MKFRRYCFCFFGILMLVICLISPSKAGEVVVYISTSSPYLHFRYIFELKECHYEIQKPDSSSQQIDFAGGDFDSCYGAFLADVDEYYPGFEIALPLQSLPDTDDTGVVIDGVPQLIAKIFWLFTYWGVLHIFFSIIP